MTIIIDNFLPEKEYEEFTTPVFKGQIPIYFRPDRNYGKDMNAFDVQFVHRFYHDGIPTESFGHVDYIVNKIVTIIENSAEFFNTPVALQRVKMNVTHWTQEVMQDGFHIDNPTRHIACILYLNTTNGPTVFEDGEKVDCVSNRLIIFDGKRKHAGCTTSDTNIRAVLNINFLRGEIM